MQDYPCTHLGDVNRFDGCKGTIRWGLHSIYFRHMTKTEKKNKNAPTIHRGKFGYC